LPFERLFSKGKTPSLESYSFERDVQKP